MGLDGVELILECEDEFGIQIPDTEASKVVTVADLYALICRLRDPATAVEPALTVQTVGEALRETGLRPETVDESTQLADLVPVAKRWPFWNGLQRRLGTTLPDLVAPIGGKWVLLWSLIWAVAGTLAGVPGIVIMLVVGLVTAALLQMVMQRVIPAFPANCRTVQGLIDRVPPGKTGLQVWRRLVLIISEQLGVRPEEITLETRFVEDLKVD